MSKITRFLIPFLLLIAMLVMAVPISAAAPTGTTEAPTGTTMTAAGTVTGNWTGSFTSFGTPPDEQTRVKVWFEYGLDASYGYTTSKQTLIAERITPPYTVTRRIPARFIPGYTYHYRMVIGYGPSYATLVNCNDQTLTIGTPGGGGGGGDDLSAVAEDIIPTVDGTYDLGDSSHAFRNAFIDALSAPIGGDTTFRIAAANSAATDISQAHYKCDGTTVTGGDQVEINAAIQALPARGGKLSFAAGSYYFDGTINIDRPVVLEGMGYNWENPAGLTIFRPISTFVGTLISQSGSYYVGEMTNIGFDGQLCGADRSIAFITLDAVGGDFMFEKCGFYFLPWEWIIKSTTHNLYFEKCFFEDNGTADALTACLYVTAGVRTRVLNSHFRINKVDLRIAPNEIWITGCDFAPIVGLGTLSGDYVFISNNNFKGTTQTPAVTGLKLDTMASIVSKNLFLGWEDTILDVDNDFGVISDNLFGITSTNAAIQMTGTPVAWDIHDNDFNLHSAGPAINGAASMLMFNSNRIRNPGAVVLGTSAAASAGTRNNSGFTTENSGSSTGTGSQQTIAHGLGFTPTPAQIALIAGSATASPYHSAAPDATNIYVTATTGQAWYWATVGR
jgi:hypothetical protein